MVDPARQQELLTLEAQNRARNVPRFAGVELRSRDELDWIMGWFGWSGMLDTALPRADLRQIRLAQDVDLTGVELNGADLAGADLNGAMLRQAKLNGAVLRGALLGRSDLTEAELRYADLTEAILNWARLGGANLSGATLVHAILGRADLRGARLERADLSRAQLPHVRLTGANLTEATLTGALLDNAKLNNVSAYDAHLENASLEGANLNGIFLDHATLTKANLGGARMQQATLSDAVLRDTDLTRCNLSGAALTRADLSGANLCEARLDDMATLIDVKLDSRTCFGDIIWNAAPVIRVDWKPVSMKRGIIFRRIVARIGDEHAIQEAKRPKKFQKKSPTAVAVADRDSQAPRGPFRRFNAYRRSVAQAYRDAARAYHGLMVVLRAQGLGKAASAFHLRKQQLERKALFWEGRPIASFFSWLLDTTSGYGELPLHALRAYLLVVFVFAGAYYVATNYLGGQVRGVPLNPDESIVLSFTSFHGRGFFPGALPLGGWIANLAAGEAIIGLFIELMLIAAFSRRFLTE